MAAFAAEPVSIDVPAGTLSFALSSLAKQTGISVGFAGALPVVHVPRVRGAFTAAAALARLLRPSGFTAVQVDDRTFRLERQPERLRAKIPKIPALSTRHQDDVPDDITVTAGKRSERAGDIPVSLSIIHPDRLAAGARDSDGVIAATDGAISTNLGPGRNRIFLRGVADSAFSGPTQSTVGLYLDEARVSYASPDPDLRMVDIDRVEILRGPQGALYGSGALGGIIRLVTVKPDPDHWSGLMAGYASTVSHGGLGGGMDVVLNAPIRRETVAVRAVAYSEVLPGWVDNLGTGIKDANRVQRSSGRIAIAWTPDADWSASGGFIGQWINARDSQYSDGTGEFAKRTAIAEPHDNDFLIAHGEFAGKVSDLDLTGSAAYVHHEIASIYDASRIASRYAVAAPLAYHEQSDLTLISGELRLSRNSASRPWLLGVAVLSASDNIRGKMESPQSGFSIRDDEDDNKEIALFGEATEPILRHIDLRVGLRAFAADESDERSLGTKRSYTHFGVTPAVTLSWHPRDGANLWLRYASAVRPGGLTGTTSPPTFKSDELQSIESGWKIAFGQARLTLSGALFGYRWENLQSDMLGPDGFVATINAGTARDLGIEATALYGLGTFRLEAGFTLQRARLDVPIPGQDDDRHLPVVPDILAHLRATLPFDWGAAHEELFVAARYQGRSRLSFDPSVGREAAAFATLDAGLTIVRDSWSASMDATNLLNADSNSFSYGNPFTLLTTLQRTPARPRMITLRVERRF